MALWSFVPKQVLAQEKIAFGISTQIFNTRFLTNVSNFQTKGIYRPGTVAFVDWKFSKRYDLRSGLGYSLMTQNSDVFKNNINYLVVPVYLKSGQFKENSRFAFTKFYGVNLHYLLGTKHIALDGTKTDITNECRKFHFDLTAGVGVKYKLSNQFTLEALAAYSLGYFINKPNDAFIDINNFNSGFMLNLSYRLKK